MKATYIGNTELPKDENTIPDTFEMFGVTFEKGKATEVPPELEAKFAGNSSFTTTGKETDTK